MATLKAVLRVFGIRPLERPSGTPLMIGRERVGTMTPDGSIVMKPGYRLDVRHIEDLAEFIKQLRLGEKQRDRAAQNQSTLGLADKEFLLRLLTMHAFITGAFAHTGLSLEKAEKLMRCGVSSDFIAASDSICPPKSPPSPFPDVPSDGDTTSPSVRSSAARPLSEESK